MYTILLVFSSSNNVYNTSAGQRLQAVALRKTLILRMWENLLKRRRPTLRQISDTASRRSLFLIEEGEIKMVVAEEKCRKRYWDYGHWKSLAQQAGIMAMIQCTQMAMVLHMILTVGTVQTAARCLIVAVGDGNHQTRQIQRQQQCRDDSPSSYVQVCLHKSGCKVTLFYRITRKYTTKKFTTRIQPTIITLIINKLQVANF